MANKKHGGRYLRKVELLHMIVDLFNDHAGEVMDARRIWRELGLTAHPSKLLCMDCIDDLLLDDYTVQSPFSLPSATRSTQWTATA